MKQKNFVANFVKSSSALFLILIISVQVSKAQQLKMTDFVLFGGTGVEMLPAINVQGGSVGSFQSIKSYGITKLNSNIYSGGTIDLSSFNNITGNISAGNSKNVPGNAVSIGYFANIGGNIDVNGNTFIAGGTVSGKVTYPAGYNYKGPLPKGGKVIGQPTLPTLPALPSTTNFPPVGENNITSNQTITPNSYGDIILNGGQTITFSGPGVYVFNSIKNIGLCNNFVFDFQNSTSGTFQIYIYNDANLGKVNATMINGGSASKIYTEIHGTGGKNGITMSIDNDFFGKSSTWLGTVWAPNGAISIGSGTGASNLTGALLSGTKVFVLSGVSINYAAYAGQGFILPYYPPPANGKVNDLLGAELNSLYNNSTTLTDPQQNIFIIRNDSVMIEVIALQGKVSELLSTLTSSSYGLTNIINNGPNSLIITGLFPIANLAKLDSLTTLIDYCRPVYPPLGNIGVTTTAGDIAIHSDFVRNGYNVSGDGVKVAVISDSYNTIPGNPASTDVANGDLPGVGNPYGNTTPVQVLQDYPFGRSTDEGRAMLQIVHDIAPKAQLGFRTGFISAGDFAQGIRDLKQNNYNVIVDDVTYITEPFLQDGVVAQAIDEVTSQGVSYFAAAGNYGNTSYQSTFNATAAPAGLTGSAHNFGGGDIYQNVSLQPGTYTIVLQWQDAIYSLGQTPTGTVNDLDIYLTDMNGSPLFGFNRNNIGGDPIEVLPFTVTSPTQANLMIIRAAGNTPVNFKYVVFRGDLTINEYNSGQSTIVGSANAAGAMTVAAIRYTNTPAFGTNPPVTESFSSLGGTVVNGVNRNKPDFTGPDGVNTTVNFNSLNIEGDQFPNFFGTSAAAPHAAGVAALLLQSELKFANHALSPAEMRNLLKTTALDIDSPGFDFLSGSGLIQAQAALATFAAPTPVVTGLVVPPNITPGQTSFTVTVNGNYFTDQTKILFRGAPLTTAMVNSTQLTATIAPFTGNPAIQAYTAPKSVNQNDGGTSAAIYFFSIVKKKITVTADDKTKKYGEKVPPFTVSILVDGIPLANSGLTLSDLGLDSITFSTPANDFSNVGNYYIKAIRTFDSTNATDEGLQELYNYTFVDGLLSINKLPLKITPNDITATYGDKIQGITFKYEYADSNIDPADRTTFLNNLEAEHASNLVDSVIGFVNGKAIVAGKTLTAADLNDMSFLASGKAIVAGKAIVEGILVTDMNVIEISPASIYNYQVDSSSGSLINGKAIVGGKAIVEGKAIVAGKAIVGGIQIANSVSINDSSNNNVVVIIDSADINSSDQITLSDLKSINLITALDAGSGFIVPGALISENFEITYGLGNLTILPAQLTVTADDKVIFQRDRQPVFTSTITGFAYHENTIISGPSYFVKDLNCGAPGTYPITPYGLVLSDSTNYTISYVSGTLYVNPRGGDTRNVRIKLNCVDAVTNNPSGYSYVAHFSYTNPNCYTVYVPIGSSNLITSSDPYGGVQPQVFLPGTGNFDIYFDGAKMVWSLTTYNCYYPTTVKAYASSSSPKCNYSSLAYSPTENNIAISSDNPDKISAYPNPATTKTRISVGGSFTFDNNIMLLDLLGKPHTPKSIEKISANSFDIDLSNLSSGVYLLKMKINNTLKTLQIIKL